MMMMMMMMMICTLALYSILTECQKSSWCIIERALNVYMKETYT